MLRRAQTATLPAAGRRPSWQAVGRWGEGARGVRPRVRASGGGQRCQPAAEARPCRPALHDAASAPSLPAAASAGAALPGGDGGDARGSAQHADELSRVRLPLAGGAGGYRRRAVGNNPINRPPPDRQRPLGSPVSGLGKSRAAPLEITSTRQALQRAQKEGWGHPKRTALGAASGAASFGSGCRVHANARRGLDVAGAGCKR